MAIWKVSSEMKTLELEDRWNELQLHAVNLMKNKRTTEGISLVDTFVNDSDAIAFKSEALAFRADLSEDVGRYENAAEDYVAAWLLMPVPSYSRYSVEIALAGLYEKQAQRNYTLKWYHLALETALQLGDCTGATAIRGLSLLSALDSCDRSLCERVIVKAWQAAGLLGSPDLLNLADAAETIIDSSP
jgi:hypothetical protein